MTTDATMVPAQVAVTAVEVQQGPPGPVGATGPQGLPGLPPVDYALAIAAAGQTAFSLSPAPVVPNSIGMTVNGVTYRAPVSLSYDPRTAVLTWLGSFALLPSDDVSVHYF